MTAADQIVQSAKKVLAMRPSTYVARQCASDSAENHALQPQDQTSSPLRQQRCPEIWWGEAKLLHREIQAKWPTRATLASRFSVIRRIPSNYQRPSVWGIENGCHYVRDTAFAEDASRIRKNPDIVARLRSFAYNLIRARGSDNIRNARWRAALDFNLLLKILGSN